MAKDISDNKKEKPDMTDIVNEVNTIFENLDIKKAQEILKEASLNKEELKEKLDDE